jgi:hypothetical protein
MLAGRVKLNSFLMVAGVVLAAGGAGVGLVLRASLAERAADRALEEARAAAEAAEQAARDQELAAASARVAAAAAATVSAEAPAGTNAPAAAPTNMRAHDSEVLAYVGRDIGTDKLKDVSRGKAWKINIYQDSGSKTANRAKVDLDRDDKWDEKWTFDPEGVQLQIDPHDNESYSEVRYWDGSNWNER